MSAIDKLKEVTYELSFMAKDYVNSHKWPERPQMLNFEITSICDSKCIHCPRQEMERSMKPMDFDLFCRLIDQAAELKIPELFPNGYGEILTMKNLDKYLSYITDKEHKFQININTNAFRLTDEKIELFIKHKVNLLNICIDGATAETAEKVRVQLKLDQIENNIDRLMEKRKELGINFPKIRAGFVEIPENKHESDMFVEKWKDRVDFVGIDGYSNRAGTLDAKYGKPTHPPGIPACSLPFKALNVYADGNAVICCNDWNEKHIVGDFNKQSLQEIWQGEALKKVRAEHIKNQGGNIEICKNCNSWVKLSKGAKLWA